MRVGPLRSQIALNGDKTDRYEQGNADVRRLQVEFIDQADSVFSGIGAKGVGEVACIGAAAAIRNAVYQANRQANTTPANQS